MSTNKNKESWKNVWKGPFRYDHYGYVWSYDNVMVFTVDDLTEENDKWMQDFCNNMAKALNNEECEKYPGLHIKDGVDLYQYDNLIGYFRGWGHLTGTGGLNLSDKEAIELQDQMIQVVLERICTFSAYTEV